MRTTTGQIIRISGLLIEMLGIWGVYNGTGNKDQAVLQLPGGTVVSPAWIAVGLGFVLWLTGTILVYGGRRTRKSLEKDQRELSP
jgi:hypothetical protein